MSHLDHCFPRRRGVKSILALTIGGFVLAVVFALAFGWLVMLLWNWLMPNIFGLKMITYWQGFGLSLLGKLIFGGMHGHRGPHPYHRHPKHFASWCGDQDESAPGGDRRNWIYYRQYWNEQGKKDFEDYLGKKKMMNDE